MNETVVFRRTFGSTAFLQPDPDQKVYVVPLQTYVNNWNEYLTVSYLGLDCVRCGILVDLKICFSFFLLSW